MWRGFRVRPVAGLHAEAADVVDGLPTNRAVEHEALEDLLRQRFRVPLHPPIGPQGRSGCHELAFSGRASFSASEASSSSAVDPNKCRYEVGPMERGRRVELQELRSLESPREGIVDGFGGGPSCGTSSPAGRL